MNATVEQHSQTRGVTWERPICTVQPILMCAHPGCLHATNPHRPRPFCPVHEEPR